MDLADRKVIGWSLGSSLKVKDTVVPAWLLAVNNRPITGELLFHSDRGIHYACDEFKTLLSGYKSVVRSMSRKGNCWDNAVAESFFKTLKIECIYHKKYLTVQQRLFQSLIILKPGIIPKGSIRLWDINLRKNLKNI